MGKSSRSGDEVPVGGGGAARGWLGSAARWPRSPPEHAWPAVEAPVRRGFDPWPGGAARRTGRSGGAAVESAADEVKAPRGAPASTMHGSTGWFTGAAGRPRLPPRQRGSGSAAAFMVDDEVRPICCCLTQDGGGLTRSAAEKGAAPGGGHGEPPQGRARRPSRGRPGGASWRTGGARGGASAALGVGQRKVG